MTPELKTSCEVVFQEHKIATTPIAWNKDVFRGRMSIGLCELTKEMLVEKKIIYFPKPTRKTFTILNPEVAAAATFEEAIEIMQTKTPAPAKVMDDHIPYDEDIPMPAYLNYTETNTDTVQLINNNGQSEVAAVQEKWYLKPVFYYVVWPVSAAIVSVLIAYGMSELVEMSYKH